MSYQTVEADFLVIGGGTAGTMAAIRAKELNPEAKVVIFEKGNIKRSGSIAMGMDAMNIVAVPGANTPEEYVETNKKACHGILDAKPSYALADRSYAMVKRLESWGVYFPKDEDGDYERLQVHPNGRFCLTMPEQNLKVILAQKVEEHGVTVFNRTMATRLLTQDDRVAGAVGLNIRTGELIVCKAKAVLLSNGGASRFGIPNTGALHGTYDYPGNAGDGYALAFRAGAKITGFEYCMSYALMKDINMPAGYVAIGRGGKLYDALGQEIDMGGTINQDVMVQKCQDGRGPLFINVKDLPEEKIKAIEDLWFSVERPMMKNYFEGRGLDLRKDNIELVASELFLCGGHGLTGIMVDEKAKSTLKGLFAAGDVANVSRGHLTGAFTFGEIAAEEAQELFNDEFDIDWSQVEAEQKNIEELLNTKENEVSVEKMEYKVRRVINDYIPSPKNEYKLNKCQKHMKEFRENLKSLVRVNDYNELSRAIEISFIIDCAELCTVASLARKESRWGPRHFRADYPQQDDQNWLKHVVLSVGNSYPEINVEFKPVDDSL
ncbi:FAD-binding protein [Desulforamulus aeronauticus]|uniref:Succinate dehydrogenase/fumarate reductase, flavoprotein subunit n=1 Tax=Desulforamulus aeronauticus DSM 10349 TaxID=1121421 RepID=A0A1M6NHB9_9FIRM|nr:FAD-binding protein [Desulforamulus aeronauticus]SHJ95026.1 Succinate dehydrogenase/fumarate reductase, flavoprotein subunit [Desulforamulus aeronauticus DSM 10349]